jgi:hypothetical protein
VYLTHFFATLVVAAALWLWAHERFARYASMVCLLAAMGFSTYVLFPAVPPWMASGHAYLHHTARIVGIVWSQIPIAHFSTLFEKGERYANDVAAMPSLHAGYALLIPLYLWRSLRWWARVPLALYPLAMTFALVYSAEHYVVDCLFGWLYALVAFAAVHVVADRWPHRAAAPAAARVAAPHAVEDTARSGAA